MSRAEIKINDKPQDGLLSNDFKSAFKILIDERFKRLINREV
jgi:retron-type reverse transcriptase